MKNKIGWCDQTWNPIIGCDKISDACKECYAEKMAGRLCRMKSTYYYLNVIDYDINPHGEITTKGWNGKTHLVESALQKPLKRKNPTKYFVCSMGDLFHESVDFDWIDKVMAIIARSKQHTFQILTKRPKRMKEYFNDSDRNRLIHNQNCNIGKPVNHFNWPLENLWLGITVENQKRANERIPILLEIPAKVRFVSIEPMLGEIILSVLKDTQDGVTGFYNVLRGYSCHESYHVSRKDDIYKEIPKLDWVICGGETGQNARPMKREWVENLLNQCKSANIPFFFKSWGTCQEFKGLKKLSASHLIDSKEYKEFPIIK